MRFQCLCLLAAMLAPCPVFAQSGGMKYTTIGDKSEKLEPNRLTVKSLNFQKEQEEEQAIEAGQAEEQKAMDAVWNHYKALAESRPEPAPVKPAAPAKPKTVSLTPPQPAEPAEQKAVNGLNILGQYEQIKARRSQMKTITVTRQEESKPPSP